MPIIYVRWTTESREIEGRGCRRDGSEGRAEWLPANPGWSIDEEASRALIRLAIDAGINFFDTANMYSNGGSEEIVGRALKEFASRDAVVIATKLFAPMRDGPDAAGLSRKTILAEVDRSLKRLGTDYIDLYQIHRRRTPVAVKNTIRVAVSAMKARYNLRHSASD